MRQTSIAVFKQIQEEGLLSRLRFDVYSALYKRGPCTALELYKSCFEGTHRDHSITPRFSELERAGVIAATEERPCRVSGRNVTVWQTTNNLPVKFDKPKRTKCKHCNGKGYTEEAQGKLI